jgi:hypothetical protein
MLCGITGCAGFLQPSVPDVSPHFEPPRAWGSGIRFRLGDPVIHHPRVNYTTRVEFVSGRKSRIVTNKDLFTSSNGAVITPWYRADPMEDPITLRITVEHSGGVKTTAEYPLFIKKGEFYSVGAHVHTRQPAPSDSPYLDINPVAFPLNPNAAAQPGDSLWVSFSVASRECFDCPT